MKNIVKLVREKIDLETARAEQISSRDHGHESILDEMFGDIPPSVTNVPPGVRLPHFLLFGGTSLIPLEPLSEQEFENRLGLDARTVLELTDRNLIVPSIYDRDPENWGGKDHLRALVQKSIVNGARVDALMGEDYSNNVKRHETRFQRCFTGLSKAERLLWPEEARVFPPKTLPQALAHRVARLQELDNEAAQEALAYFESGNLAAFLWFVEVAKLRTAHLTTGGGKNYVVGPLDLALFREPLAPARRPYSLADLYSSYDGKFLTQAMEYVLLEVLAKTRPFEPVDWHIEGRKLLEFVTRSDNAYVRDHLWRILDDLADLAWANGNIDPLVDDYKRLIADYQKRLKELIIIAGAAVGAASGMVVGLLIPGAIGSGLGAFLGTLLGASVTREGSPLLNAAIRKLYDRRAYRVLSGLEYVTGDRGRSTERAGERPSPTKP